jgi:hypothetical protein
MNFETASSDPSTQMNAKPAVAGILQGYNPTARGCEARGYPGMLITAAQNPESGFGNLPPTRTVRRRLPSKQASNSGRSPEHSE